jgi:PLP dependent protein
MIGYSGIAESVSDIRERMTHVAQRCGRRPEDILLIAVTKTVPAEKIQEAVVAGINDLGENRVQEGAEKIPQIQGKITWHLVGHLQTNKARKAVALFDWIQSLDSLQLAEAVGKASRTQGKVIQALVEVNTSGEESKFGFPPQKVVDEIAALGSVEGLNVRGLMTVGKLGTAEEARACFRTLRTLRAEIAKRDYPGISMEHLSMGMTGDFEAAIEEGATMVRIGTAIFGPRG